MADYLSTFAVGFEEPVAELLTRHLPGVRITRLLGGLVQYRYDGPARLIEKLPFLHNVFSLLIAFPVAIDNFEAMVAAAAGQRCHYLPGFETFRVRFVHGNTFAGVTPALLSKAERVIERASGMRSSRGQAQTELWYIIRSEGLCYYAQQLFSRPDKSAPGALRPDLAYLTCTLAHSDRNSTVLDPFCGSGSLIRQFRDHLPYGRLYASDLDPKAIQALRGEPLLKPPQGEVQVADAMTLQYLQDDSIDIIVTDPPWGDYAALDDAESFYGTVLLSLCRVLRPGGRLVMLTARKEELTRCAAKAGMQMEQTIHTLVNGKKAGVFVLTVPAEVIA